MTIIGTKDAFLNNNDKASKKIREGGEPISFYFLELYSIGYLIPMSRIRRDCRAEVNIIWKSHELDFSCYYRERQIVIFLLPVYDQNPNLAEQYRLPHLMLLEHLIRHAQRSPLASLGFVGNTSSSHLLRPCNARHETLPGNSSRPK